MTKTIKQIKSKENTNTPEPMIEEILEKVEKTEDVVWVEEKKKNILV
ncbi:hypothetical protein bcgnr5378_05600 [Bacillus cereus]|uniref:Uncharacterized protein n=1 Tax=Bacillus cereus TaxID=1396 RepID=A0A162NWD7_BACCE|nr:hypothetical protein [Bacillus cereus]KZD55663.1 hypothetical protein B4088_5408 [Bacillus cereus]